MSGRKRFNCYSEDSVEQEGQMMYQKIMQETQGAILPSWDSRTRMVERVMNRLIPASGLEHVNWEVYVINSPETKNAFVIPGGKVFVYSGILPICQTDDGLAAVLAHEISHNLAQHAAERMSSVVIIAPLRWALIYLDATGVTGGLGQLLGSFALDLGFARPASRKQESEADYIGLMMMAQSCYDPNAAVGLWRRMEKAQENEPPEWISTHPSNANRIERIRAWLPKAEEKRNESGCAVALGYSQDFNNTLKGLGRFLR